MDKVQKYEIKNHLLNETYVAFRLESIVKLVVQKS